MNGIGAMLSVSLFFLRSVSLLSTRRCGSWHCHREGEGQWSGYWWKCAVVLWHHRWRRNSTLWDHFWCPGPGWHYKTKKGKLRVCSSSRYLFETRVLKFIGVGWTPYLWKVEPFLHLIPLAPLPVSAKAMPASHHGVGSFVYPPSYLSHRCPRGLP